MTRFTEYEIHEIKLFLGILVDLGLVTRNLRWILMEPFWQNCSDGPVGQTYVDKVERLYGVKYERRT